MVGEAWESEGNIVMLRCMTTLYSGIGSDTDLVETGTNHDSCKPYQFVLVIYALSCTRLHVYRLSPSVVLGLEWLTTLRLAT